MFLSQSTLQGKLVSETKLQGGAAGLLGSVMDSRHHQLEEYQEERPSSRTVGPTGRRGIWRGAKKVSDSGSKTGVYPRKSSGSRVTA